MRISDWSSDVCSSDLGGSARAGWRAPGPRAAEPAPALPPAPDRRDRPAGRAGRRAFRRRPRRGKDRKSVVWGKSVSGRVDSGGGRIIKKQIALARATSTERKNIQLKHYSTQKH